MVFLKNEKIKWKIVLYLQKLVLSLKYKLIEIEKYAFGKF